MALATTAPDFQHLSTLILVTEVLKPYIVKGVCGVIQGEIAALSSKKEASILMTTTAYNLQNLSWEAIANEWKTKAPVFFAKK